MTVATTSSSLNGTVVNVANWAHGVGLAAGALLGCMPHLLKQLSKKR